ncbi:MAG: DUF433 domain-containing protein [Candidatus Aminicenantes bacterium]|nr:DUF433 domain-containing protein [Candidatus Aminicenantes bacterium]
MNLLTSEIETKIDPFKEPIYYSTEVARLVKITPARVIRWLKGYKYFYSDQIVSKPPVVPQRKELSKPENDASFYDLIELLFVKQFLDYGISLQKLRKAFDEAKRILGIPHLAHQVFFTDGKNICLKVKNKGDAILELLSGGQWVIHDIIVQLAYQIDFDTVTQEARRWYPPEGNRLVILDPLYSFGQPIIKDRGIRTEIIYDLYLSEGKKIDVVCKWYNLSQKEVNAAINFQSKITA